MGNEPSKQPEVLQWKDYLENCQRDFQASVTRGYQLEPQDHISGFALEDFDLFSELGSGAFAEVYLAHHRHSRCLLALKMLDKRKVIEKHQQEHVRSEKMLLSLMDLPFIIKLHLSFQTRLAICLGLEYVSGGELFSLLRQKRTFPEPHAVFYASQVVLALEYMHELDIVYRDLKPENILMDSQGYIKLADMGFAKVVHKRTYTMCGTPEYIAPEILVYKGYGKAVDWWALGILVYEMLCGYSAFYAEDVMDIYSNILEANVRFPRDSKLSRAARNLIKSLLEKDLSKRFGTLHAGVADIRNHPWFADLDWISIYKGQTQAPYKSPGPKPARPDKELLKKVISRYDSYDLPAYASEKFSDF